MTKNYLIRYQKIAIVILVAILFGLLIFYFIFRSKSPPPLTEMEVRQAIIDSTTAPTTSSVSMNTKERQQLIDSTTAPTPKTTTIINNKKVKYNEN